MKLYATTTSERASKGQGGNSWLKIRIQAGEERRIIAKIEVVANKKANYTNYQIWHNGDMLAEYDELDSIKTKGKQQKDEKVPCMNCGSMQLEKDINYLGDQAWRCPNCN